VTLTAQVTLLLLLALALAWFMRRGSARTLHLLWTVTFALVLALPVLGFFGPSWDVPILPARGGESAPAAIEAVASALSSDASGSTATRRKAAVREAFVQGELAGLAARAGGTASASADAAAGRSVARIGWIVWLVGCALSLASLAVAAPRLRRLVRLARPVHDPEWAREAAALRHRLGLRSEVRLLFSESVATPMTGGLQRPVILLPASAAEWSPERRAVVLSHELIHVRRRDALRQLVRRTVLALYWFHPLAWIASRHATLASEKACDEGVLALGVRPSDYARHLLFMATGSSRGPRVLAIPIVHPSQLERRITSILARRRPCPSRARAALTLTVLGVAGVFVAAARPVPIEEQVGTPAASIEARREVVSKRAEQEAALVPTVPAALQEVECLPSSDSIRSFAFRDGGEVVPGWKWTDGGFTIARSVAGMRLCMRGEGDVTLNDEGTAVQALGDDSWLVIESTSGKGHRLVVTRGPEGVEREWSVNGTRGPFDAEARRWRDLMFRIMNRYRDAWVSYSHGLVLYGRILGYRGQLSDLQSAMRDARRAEVLRELERDLGGWERGLRRITETIRHSDLDARLTEIAGRVADIDLAAASSLTEIEASDLDRRLLEVSELSKRSAGTPDLEQRLGAAERSLEDVIVELQRVTR
jgi:beta-lactamase regulating signal transducer with metallopeptidase domain